MATITSTLSIFKKSFAAVLSGSVHYLQGTPTLAVLDEANPTTEDTTVTGDEFLDEVAGATILQSVALTTPVLTGLLLDADDSAADELTDIGAGNDGDKVILYDNTGTPATSRVWAIGTLSATLSGDDVDDDIQFASGLINFDG